MSDIAIRVEGLSKRYRIGEQERYKALRDVITDGVASPFRKLRSALSRNGANRGSSPTVREGSPGHSGTMGNGNSSLVSNDSLLPSVTQNSKLKTPNSFWALDNVSFEVKRGEVVGIIGRNGAGKSTLLKILSRITAPTKGEVEIHGRVGSLLEVGTGFHPELTGRENIYLNGAILGMKRAEIARKFDEIVAFAEVEKFIDTPVKRYSSGMYVRLAFAVAAHMETEVLLVDEVLAVGDAQFQKKCLGKMGDVAKQGRTVLFVSHDMTAIRALCSRAVQLRNGQVIGFGSVESQVENYIRAYKENVGNRLAGPLMLSESIRLERLDATPNPVISGNSLNFEIELGLARNVAFNEFAVLIHNVLNSRIALIDLRQSNITAKGNGSGSRRVSVSVESLPLVEGEYFVGLWVDTDEVASDFHDLLSLTVINQIKNDCRTPYPARARGTVELEFEVK
jgi:lipopolysaccharide transport system ATP-binding protein